VDNLRSEVVKELMGMAEKDLFGGREGNGEPPGKVLVGERTAGWKLEHITVKQTVKAVAGHGLDPNQAAAMGEQAACLADVGGGESTLGG
jgi:hypothetical protein